MLYDVGGAVKSCKALRGRENRRQCCVRTLLTLGSQSRRSQTRIGVVAILCYYNAWRWYPENLNEDKEFWMGWVKMDGESSTLVSTYFSPLRSLVDIPFSCSISQDWLRLKLY